MLKFIAVFFCLFAFSIPVLASDTPAYIAGIVPDAAPVGQGRMTYMMFDLYDAKLYAPAGTYQPGKPFALELSYLRDLDGKKIADKSIEEIERLGEKNPSRLSSWHAAMIKNFPNVSKGTVLTGFYQPGKATVFYLNGKSVGSVADPAFGPAFFGIWLDPQTMAPDVRRKLIGQTKKGSDHAIPQNPVSRGSRHDFN